jgi:hypothetical protein
MDAWAQDERLELIDGEIVQRSMARFHHGLAQAGLNFQVQTQQLGDGQRGGWWTPLAPPCAGCNATRRKYHWKPGAARAKLMGWFPLTIRSPNPL